MIDASCRPLGTCRTASVVRQGARGRLVRIVKMASSTLICACLFAAPLAVAQTDRTVDNLQKTMAAFHDDGQFDGAVLVAREGEILYSAGFGLANHEWNVSNTPATKFRIGSITKTFTTTLVLMLVEEGLLELPTPISAYLPEFRQDTGG